MNSSFFFFVGNGRLGFRLVRPLLEPLETDEIAHLALRLARELLELDDELAGLGILRLLRLAEELSHLQVENVENLEERVEADPVLPLLHPREIGLRHDDLRLFYMRWKQRLRATRCLISVPP